MNWQDIFYALGSIAFVLTILMIVGMSVISFMAYKAVRDIKKKAMREVSSMAFEMGEMGGVIVGKTINKVSSFFRNKKEDITYLGN